MKQFEYVIQDELGLHARPAGLLVKQAAKFESTMKIAMGDKSADLKRLFAVMGLGVKGGDKVTVTAEGTDEEAAAGTIQKFLQDNV